MKKPLGCFSLSGCVTAALVLLALGGFILVGGGTIFSPGSLNAQAGKQMLGGVSTHGDLSHRCEACHAPFWGRQIMSDRCMVCHTNISTELKAPASLHGALTEGIFTPCQKCHTEHKGTTAYLTVIDQERFPHTKATGYDLQAHQKLANGDPFTCAACHPQNLGDFNQQTCEDCHRDDDAAFMQAHINTFGGACLACHDGVDTYGAAFDHNQTKFRLEGAHLKTDCAGCHEGQFTLTTVKATPQECYGCHQKDDPHNGQYGEHCAACHTSATWEETTFDHAQTHFPLTGAHVEVECQACHRNNVFKNTPQQCFACHQKDDAHRGQFGQDCAQCHATTNWGAATFDHSQTGFPLTGVHTQVECQACHVNNVFKGTPQQCFACHQKDDAHRGGFGQDCAQCHTANTWESATFDHNRTAFPLAGAHTQVKCEACHVNNVFEGTPQQCFACHQKDDAHQGEFGQDCAGCHTANAWTPAGFNGPHRFPMDHGASGPSSCRTCHPDNLETYTCYGCHEHTPANIEREHREEGISDFQDCVRCHPTGREEEGEGEGD